jgi:RHS repeat-associated protein
LENRKAFFFSCRSLKNRKVGAKRKPRWLKTLNSTFITSYERDNETELDFAQARMYSKNHGRFTTTDPTLLSVNGFNPQSWNRYVYVLNNPLLYTDPLGLWEVRYDEVYKDKKNKDGTVTKVFSHYVAKAYKTKGDKDTPAELARQLGLKGKEADKFVENFNKKGFSDGVEMTKLGGDVGRIFGVVQDKLSDQRKEDEKGKGNNPSDGTYADCSSTSANLYSPLSGANGENWSVYVMDEYIKNNLTSKSEEDLRVGDVVRYANDKNVPKHFTTFIFRNDDGVPQVFSRSGEGGRFERGSASNFTSANPRYSSYGTIRGIGKNSTGYYGRR